MNQGIEVVDNIVRLSNVLKGEHPSYRFTREAMDVTKVDGMRIGSVVTNTGALVTVATTANAYGVIVDDRIYNMANGVNSTVVLSNGYAEFAKQALHFGADINTDAEINAVLAVLKAKNIITSEQIPG